MWKHIVIINTQFLTMKLHLFIQIHTKACICYSKKFKLLYKVRRKLF